MDCAVEFTVVAHLSVKVRVSSPRYWASAFSLRPTIRVTWLGYNVQYSSSKSSIILKNKETRTRNGSNYFTCMTTLIGGFLYTGQLERGQKGNKMIMKMNEKMKSRGKNSVKFSYWQLIQHRSYLSLWFDEYYRTCSSGISEPLHGTALLRSFHNHCKGSKPAEQSLVYLTSSKLVQRTGKIW